MTKKTYIYVLILFLILGFIFLFSLPSKLFTDPYCIVLKDRNDKLLDVQIAADHQWRFPPSDSIPAKFRHCIIQFEDKRFYAHPGVDPLALLRAFWLNIQHLKKKSGGSTITMQVIRLSRKGKSRTIVEKIIEMFLALRYELTCSKHQILSAYLTNAPYGGNVVGYETAAWRYYGRDAGHLSWAESAALSVLPNSPSLIRPGKNRKLYKEKRNRLLNTLFTKGMIDSLTYLLSLKEPLPDAPVPFPSLSPHLLQNVMTGKLVPPGGKQNYIRTTLITETQQLLSEILNKHYKALSSNQINNIAGLILDTQSGEVLAYCGNVKSDSTEHSPEVDIIQAPRSTGSILKPFLYAAMLSDGELTPAMLVPDIPTYLVGFSPKNFDNEFSGAVPAWKCLSRSLNVPAVLMVKRHGLEKFYHLLRKAGMSTLHKPPSHYGLSLILGGAEACLWDLAGMYRGLGAILMLNETKKESFFMPLIFCGENFKQKKPDNNFYQISTGAAWLTLQAMAEVNRPDDELYWKEFSSSRKIAWKTGTSFGFRDAWAIGLDRGYVVAIWVGNADGEGRPGLTGISCAAPILFDVFSHLPSKGWFTRPDGELVRIPVCSKSGYRIGEYCGKADSIWITQAAFNSPVCPFHTLVHIDSVTGKRVNSFCESIDNMKHIRWFTLPPAQEYFYRRTHSDYKSLPAFRKDCLKEVMNSKRATPMEIIFPKRNATVYIPVELSGEEGKVVFEAVHSNKMALLYWHLDSIYMGATMEFHKMALHPSPGKHKLTLVDENGERLEHGFEVVGR